MYLTSMEINQLKEVIHKNVLQTARRGFTINRWIRKHYDIPVRTIEVR